MKTSNINTPKLYESTAECGLFLMASQPDRASSGGVYRPESGTKLPYVCFYVSVIVSLESAFYEMPYVYNGVVIFDVAENLEATEFPLPALRGVDGRYFEISMYRRSLVVYEFDSALLPGVSQIMVVAC